VVRDGEDFLKDGVLSKGRELKISLELVVCWEGLWRILCGEWLGSRTCDNRECLLFSMDSYLIMERSTSLKYPPLSLQLGNIRHPFTHSGGICEIAEEK